MALGIAEIARTDAGGRHRTAIFAAATIRICTRRGSARRGHVCRAAVVQLLARGCCKPLLTPCEDKMGGNLGENRTELKCDCAPQRKSIEFSRRALAQEVSGLRLDWLRLRINVRKYRRHQSRRGRARRAREETGRRPRPSDGGFRGPASRRAWTLWHANAAHPMPHRRVAAG